MKCLNMPEEEGDTPRDVACWVPDECLVAVRLLALQTPELYKNLELDYLSAMCNFCPVTRKGAL